MLEKVRKKFSHFNFKTLSRFSTRRNIPRTAESLMFFIEFRQKHTLKSRIKFNFPAAENSANQSYCSLCVPHDQNNSRTDDSVVKNRLYGMKQSQYLSCSGFFWNYLASEGDQVFNYFNYFRTDLRNPYSKD